MPDIDVDFCIRGRAQVIQYVKDKYGADRVAQIATFGTLKAKAAITRRRPRSWVFIRRNRLPSPS